MDGQEPIRKERPYYAVDNPPPIQDTPPRPGFWVRLGNRLGVVEMGTTNPPKVWTWNPSVITLLILIASLLTGGGYYIGHQAAVQQQMQREIDQAAADEKRRKEMEIYNAGQKDAQNEHPKPKESKK